MPTYTNPKGSPAVTFNGRVAFTQQELAAACNLWGPKLKVPSGLDGKQFLWAFAARESSFGADCRPRHEAAYCTGKYSAHADILRAYRLWSHAAHCSFGPWQLMYCNDPLHGDPNLFGDLDHAAERTVDFFNVVIFGHDRANTLELAADAWNSGSCREASGSTIDYIAAVRHFYDHAVMPA